MVRFCIEEYVQVAKGPVNLSLEGRLEKDLHRGKHFNYI